MYKFHYEHMVPLYTRNNKCQAKLLFTDTDSLCYEVTTPDIYHDMSLNSFHYDTSSYDSTSLNFSDINSKVVEKMKDEFGGVKPLEFLGLRDKMCSILLPDNKKKSTAK